MRNQIAEFDAKFRALQTVSIMAREYVDALTPGDKFVGVMPEARKRFDVGSEGYNLFVNCAMIELDNVSIDVSRTGYIISLVRRPRRTQ